MGGNELNKWNGVKKEQCVCWIIPPDTELLPWRASSVGHVGQSARHSVFRGRTDHLPPSKGWFQLQLHWDFPSRVNLQSPQHVSPKGQVCFHKISLGFYHYQSTTKWKSPPTIQPLPRQTIHVLYSLPTNAEPMTFGFIHLFRNDCENPCKEKANMMMGTNRNPRGLDFTWSSATGLVWSLHKYLRLCVPVSSPSTSSVKFPHAGFQCSLNREAVRLDQAS